MELVIIGVFVLLGVLLLAVEVALIPGFGLVGVTGVASLVAAVVYAFTVLGVLAGWVVLGIVVVAIVLFVSWAVSGKTFRRVALKKSIDSSTKNPLVDTLKVGDEGVALTRLALVGEADFAGRQLEVTSAMGFIDEGESVYVARITEDTVFVKRK